MDTKPLKRPVLSYQRGRFVTTLPIDFLYSSTHAWMECRPNGLWRVGLTRFATRMLGEMVDHGFVTEPGQAVACGQVIGWVEGFKSISDLYCVVDGEFVGGNAVLQDRVHLISKDPYHSGWFYEAKGNLELGCLNVQAYAALLDRTIDRIMEKQSADSP